MVADAHKLHESLNDLQASYLDVAHSLSDQLTYIKKFDFSIDLNTDAITNLSSIVNDVVIQSQERLQEVTKEIMWLNISFFGQSELHTAIRQLEFALLQLTKRFDEVTNAVQYMSLGKLPISFVNPTTLHNILRNVSLQLPENFELIAGTRI